MDERMRLLERAAASGSVEDRVAILVARLRTAPGCERCGGTGQQFAALMALAAKTPNLARPCPSCAGTGSPLRARVELAAYCGDEAAIEAIGAPRTAELLAPVVGQTARAYMEHQILTALSGQMAAGARPSTFSPWLSGLSRWADVGPAPGWTLVRAAVAAARVAWARVVERASPGATHYEGCSCCAPRRAIEAAEAWLECPCEERREAWGAAMTGEPARDWLPWPPFNPSSGGSRERDAIGYRGRIEGAARLAGEQVVRDSISRDLVSWALSQDGSPANLAYSHTHMLRVEGEPEPSNDPLAPWDPDWGEP